MSKGKLLLEVANAFIAPVGHLKHPERYRACMSCRTFKGHSAFYKHKNIKVCRVCYRKQQREYYWKKCQEHHAWRKRVQDKKFI